LQLGVKDLSKIKVALVGVGNCASALVQGLKYYGGAVEDNGSIGLRNPTLGGFRPKDIEVVAAFDIDEKKVGKDLSEAIVAPPNDVPRIADVPFTSVLVNKGPILDGLGEYAKKLVHVSDHRDADVAMVLKENDADIVLNLLPSGAVKASQWYAEQSIVAGCALVNVTPNFIASDAAWAKKYEAAGLPLVGDDLIDQVGATTLHKTLLNLLSMNGVRITETYQLDVGGGMESLDTLERTKDVKRTVKTKSVEAALPYSAAVVAGSTDYVDFMQNRRDSYFWIGGVYFGNVRMQMDLKLSTVDAPNAGSVLLDLIRAVRLAMDRKLKGAVLPICAYAFKHPPQFMSLETAEKLFAEFVAGEG
jgi:myo-inositol-1-phosphate synthase